MGIISSAMLHSWEEMGCLDNDNSEELEQLKAENDRLKYELDVALREEDRWKSNFNNYRDVCRKQYQILQDIKAIVCGNYEIIDPQGRKDILKLITKAESVNRWIKNTESF